MRTLIVQGQDRLFQLKIPDKARVTLANMPHGPGGGAALRVYLGTTLLAVIPNCNGFRDPIVKIGNVEGDVWEVKEKIMGKLTVTKASF